jgi:hypothetical protein
MLAGLSATDKATIALAVVTGVLAFIALLQLWAFNRSEARRTQPVAILNRIGGADPLGIPVYISNEGVGTAYNVRVGVRIRRVEHPLGKGDGFRYTLKPGDRVPPEGEDPYLVALPEWAYSLGRPGSKYKVVFYARYENAFGQTWETINPRDPLDSFKARRARFWVRGRRFHAWWQRQKRAAGDRIFERRMQEETAEARDGKPIPRYRRVMRWLGR